MFRFTNRHVFNYFFASVGYIYCPSSSFEVLDFAIQSTEAGFGLWLPTSMIETVETGSISNIFQEFGDFKLKSELRC